MAEPTMPLFAVVTILVSMLQVFAVSGCFGLEPPPSGTILEPYTVVGRWSGHWGVDVASPMGSTVRAIGPGRVSFVGVVVGNRVVTIDHGGGVKTSYSYLQFGSVGFGSPVAAGAILGESGLHDAREAYHLSLRVGGEYVDPMRLRHCASAPRGALYLSPGPASYPRRRDRHLRRNLRPSPHGASGRGDVGRPAAHPRARAARAGW